MEIFYATAIWDLATTVDGLSVCNPVATWQPDRTEHYSHTPEQSPN
ncbi:MAG: hypothetical protein NW220_13600 [Leptolyngbyaceae cyanobacterium bins.349]|nr:hypothetical protein [Leptolyngbyaceae cyanobacterium bins.349]